jgi:hypothetical protein
MPTGLNWPFASKCQMLPNMASDSYNSRSDGLQSTLKLGQPALYYRLLLGLLQEPRTLLSDLFCEWGI